MCVAAILVTADTLLLDRSLLRLGDFVIGGEKQTEANLRASEQLLSGILGSAMDAIITIDRLQRIVSFNAAAEKIFRCSSVEVIGEKIERFIPENLRATHQAHIERFGQTGETSRSMGGRGAISGLRADGEEFFLEASISQIEAGGQKFFTVILRDISERRASEFENQRLNRLYSALSRINQTIMVVATREELFRKVCGVLVEWGGFRMVWIGQHSPEAQMIVPVAECGDEDGYLTNVKIYTDDRPEGDGPSAGAFRDGRPYICEDMLNDPVMLPWVTEVRRRRLRASAVFPIWLNGKVWGVLTVYAHVPGFFRDKEIQLLSEAAADISLALDNFAREEQRRQAEAVARSEKHFSDTIIESMPGILYLYNEQGRFLRWNRNFEIVSGYSGAEIARMHPLDFFSGLSKGALEQRIAEVFETGESCIEAPFLAKDGSETPYFFTGRRIMFDEMACLVGMGIDISERKRAEMALRELNENLERNVAERTGELRDALTRAEAADRTKSAFLATMSHELRTPLNSIIGFTGIMLQGLAGPLNAELTKQLGMVRGSARHLLELINDVLDISKIEAGELEVRPKRFDLRASIERVAASVKPMAESKGLALTITPPRSPCQPCSDQRRVEQVLLNLLNNAVKFTERGAVTLTVELAAERETAGPQPAPGTLCIRVADTGIGIKPEDLASLFQPFRQIDNGLAREYEGTGLGLAISWRLAELLGGRIDVESEWGRGSVFTFTLPLNGSA
jgi:PAS domain S-box-containing protein